VLTAHPTEVARRTLIQKYDAIAAQLAAQDHRDLTSAEREQIQNPATPDRRSLAHRRNPPHPADPVDEAKWGFAVIEHSLWQAIPNHMRKADKALHEATGLRCRWKPRRSALPRGWAATVTATPMSPPAVTREVLLLARWMAADLYLRDIDHLAAELSMQQASDALKAKAGDSAEPYRAVLKQLRDRLRATRNWARPR
jgi:phosphoenolpyruvate carboxylase